jgi:three-Cys-motif partner protein
MPKGDVVAGSPFVGISAVNAFDQVVLVESRADFSEALRARIALRPDARVTIIAGDCNESVAQIVESVGERNSMVFTVLDQEKLQARWETLQHLSEAFPVLDIILTVPTGIERVLAAADGQNRESPTLEASTGVTVEQILRQGDGSASGTMARRIREVLGRELGQASTVRDVQNRPLYEVHLYTRSTRGKSPYWRGYEAIADRLEHLTAYDVAGVLNDLKGRGLVSSG